MLRTLIPLGAALLGALPVLAEDQQTCGLDNRCPEDTPCCSQYGVCGIGAYCLGGCDPRSSYSLDACVPAPVCATKTMAMDTLDNIIDISDYLGDPTSGDWVAQGTPVINSDGNMLLTMPANSGGTVLASTVYMWYGNIKATIKTGKDAGVVTAFILLSDVKDEIDYEWVGTELDIAQTNYYFQGIPDYTHSTNITDLSDTNANFHDYEIRWTPDNITWLVDDVVGRTWQRSETWNASANQWDFPQSPARVQLSIWPAGASSNAQGTIDWAGGAIDWDSEAIQNDGYYYAVVKDVTIECYQTDTPPGTNSGTSYTYDDYRGTNDTVVDGDKTTILKSLQGTGLDMDKEDASASSTGSSSNVVPGLTGGGQGSTSEGTGGSSSSDSSSSSSSGSSGGSTTSGCDADGGFQQDCGSSSSSSSNTKSEGTRQDHVLGASAFAALVAVAGMIWI